MGFTNKDLTRWNNKYPLLEHFFVLRLAPVVSMKGTVYLQRMNAAWTEEAEVGLCTVMRNIAQEIKEDHLLFDEVSQWANIIDPERPETYEDAEKAHQKKIDEDNRKVLSQKVKKKGNMESPGV